MWADSFFEYHLPCPKMHELSQLFYASIFNSPSGATHHVLGPRTERGNNSSWKQVMLLQNHFGNNSCGSNSWGSNSSQHHHTEESDKPIFVKTCVTWGRADRDLAIWKGSLCKFDSVQCVQHWAHVLSLLKLEGYANIHV